MPIYRQGSDASEALGIPVNPKALVVGREYIYTYSVPSIAFALLTPAEITTMIKSWFTLKSYTDKLDMVKSDVAVTVTGVLVNTEANRVSIRVKINRAASAEVLESGVNPYLVLGIIGGVLAAFGLSSILMSVHDVTSGSSLTPTIDPCTQAGMTPWLACNLKKAGTLGTGVGLGSLITLVVLLFLVGREMTARA
jgi:hypothetical protein